MREAFLGSIAWTAASVVCCLQKANTFILLSVNAFPVLPHFSPQRWINEKGHLRCEICDQQYRGSFSVPPQGAAGVDEAGNMYSSMFAIRVNHGREPLGGAHNRPGVDFLDESDHYYQRNPLASWCFTFVIFVMFLVSMVAGVFETKPFIFPAEVC